MNRIDQLPRVLIVGTTPYNPNESSRALDTYFHNWPKERLRMIYSNSKEPYDDFCSSYYRITDYELLKKFFNRKYKIGTVFEGKRENKETEDINKLFKFKKVNTLRYYLRKKLWKRKRWLTQELEKWVEDFKPEIIYICFSDDYFILDISYYFAQKYNIPIIVQIGDDYYFKKYSLFMKPYIKTYKKLFDNIMNTDGFGIYISDKLADKYNSSFKKQGFPVYLSSEIKEKQNELKYEFNYFGKTIIGRIKSLAILGDALYKVDPSLKLNVYSDDVEKRYIRVLTKHHCSYNKSIPYEMVMKIMNNGSFNVIASGFDMKNIEDSRYSLSTKVADALICSGPIIAIGPKGDGAIDYLLERECAVVLSDKNVDVESLKQTISNKELLNDISKKASNVYYSEHDLDKNRTKFEDECIKLVRG